MNADGQITVTDGVNVLRKAADLAITESCNLSGSTPSPSPSPSPIAIREELVAPSCRTCHTAQFFSTSFTVYSQLQTFSFYNVCSSTSKAMPHAFITYKNFWLGGTGPAYLAGLSQTGNSCQ